MQKHSQATMREVQCKGTRVEGVQEREVLLNVPETRTRKQGMQGPDESVILLLPVPEIRAHTEVLPSEQGIFFPEAGEEPAGAQPGQERPGTQPEPRKTGAAGGGAGGSTNAAGADSDRANGPTARLEGQGHQGDHGGAEGMLNGEGQAPPPDPDADEAPGPENQPRNNQLITEHDKGKPEDLGNKRDLDKRGKRRDRGR